MWENGDDFDKVTFPSVLKRTTKQCRCAPLLFLLGVWLTSRYAAPLLKLFASFCHGQMFDLGCTDSILLTQAAASVLPTTPSSLITGWLSCCVSVVPQHRRLLYDVFTKHYRVRRSALQARLSQEFGDVSKAEVDRLLHVRKGVRRVWCAVVRL